MITTEMYEAVLCLVKDGWAWFTTQPLAEQWGDDWDDVPYEHNAGEPYEWDANTDKDKKPWKLFKVAFDGYFTTPDYAQNNSPYSVKMINGGVIVWLVGCRFSSGSGIITERMIVIPAGMTFRDFIPRVYLAGGKVYVDMEVLGGTR